jgi:anti-sigma factor ChrR (cupin superfamily)
MQNNRNVMILRDIFALETNSEHLAWQPFREGIEIYPIYKSNTGSSAALLRYAPGSSVPSHEHLGYEHILVLAGAQADEHHAYPKGSFVVSPPGTTHSIKSPGGCIVLAVWEKPVKFL